MTTNTLVAHEGELIEGRGYELLYLPSYSPDLGPIQEAFSKVKGVLRRTSARMQEAHSRDDGKDTGRGHGTRCPRVLQALSLRFTGPTPMIIASCPNNRMQQFELMLGEKFCPTDVRERVYESCSI